MRQTASTARRLVLAAALVVVAAVVGHVPASAASGLTWAQNTRIVNTSTSLALSLRADGVVVAEPAHISNLPQRWTGADSWFGATGGKSFRSTNQPAKCLAVAPDPATGLERLVLAPCVEDYTQDWVLAFDPAHLNRFRIVNHKSKKVVTIVGQGQPVIVAGLRPDALQQVFHIDNCQQCG